MTNTTALETSTIRLPVWEDDFCKAFRITKRTARRWRVERRGPKWYYVGKRVAYSTRAIEKWTRELAGETAEDVEE